MGKVKMCVLSLVLSVSVLALVTVPVSATSISGSGTSFTSEWQRYATNASGTANLVYGYNTFAINEDYAWASHSTRTHYASLSNGTGNFSGPNRNSGTVSKIEVTHNGSSVKYYCNY